MQVPIKEISTFDKGFDKGALAKRIKQVRGDLTQLQFSKVLGVSTAKVSRWEDGQNEPSASELVAIARFADCSVDELLGLGVVTPPSSGAVDAELIERIAQATAQRVARELSKQSISKTTFENPAPKEDISNAVLYQQLHLEDIEMNEWGNERVLRRVQALIQASLQKRGLPGQPGHAAEEAGINSATFDRSALRAFESGSIERMKGTTVTPGLENAIAAICNEVIGGWDSNHNPLSLGAGTYKDRPQQLLRDLLNHEHHRV